MAKAAVTDSLPNTEWVFGYGSIMWRPGFPFAERTPALLHGYHRAFCVYSRNHRGTPEVPGLVLGLARGGTCKGTALRVAPEDWPVAVDYLRDRERGYAYKPAILAVETDRRTVDAYTFVADPDHSDFAGDLGLERTAQTINDARGVSGLNRDYLINTVALLEDQGFGDAHLRALLGRVEAMNAGGNSGN